ncbi:LPS export ABC transporter permease LptF [Novispirillum itersonii subsp. nipponicum]
MLKMTRYLLRHLTAGTVLVTAGLLSILWLTQSLRFVEMIVTQGLSITNFLTLTGLLLPNFLVVIMPIALFGVVLFTYNRLSADRELVVLRAAGIGPVMLSRAALILATTVTLLTYSITLHLGPASARAFKDMQWTFRNDMSRLLIQEGAFSQIGRGLTLYVRSRSPDGELLNIMLNDERREKVVTTMMAERGALVDGPHGPRVVLVNGNRQEVDRNTGHLSLLHFQTYTMDIDTGNSTTGERSREASERSLRELLSATVGDDNGAIGEPQVMRFRAEAHQRLVNPVSSITFCLVALAILLGGSFNRRGNAPRLIAAVVTMVAIEALIVSAGNIAAKSSAMIPLIYAVVLLPIPVALFALLRPDYFSALSRRLTARPTDQEPQ